MNRPHKMYWSLFLVLILLLVSLIVGYGIKRNGFTSFVLFDRKHACPALESPVTVSEVTAILYPGQERGGDYKAHGGFRFDGLQNDEVAVRAPIDATLFAAGGGIFRGEKQYTLRFHTDCGLELMFGHLLTLTPEFQALVEGLPLPDGTVKTHAIRPQISVRAGEVIATAVGFRHGPDADTFDKPNTSFDFGVFERWIPNDISHDPVWQTKHRGVGRYEDEHGLCWLDLLPPADMARLKALPAGDFQSGKTSDYCI